MVLNTSMFISQCLTPSPLGPGWTPPLVVTVRTSYIARANHCNRFCCCMAELVLVLDASGLELYSSNFFALPRSLVAIGLWRVKGGLNVRGRYSFSGPLLPLNDLSFASDIMIVLLFFCQLLILLFSIFNFPPYSSLFCIMSIRR